MLVGATMSKPPLRPSIFAIAITSLLGVSGCEPTDSQIVCAYNSVALDPDSVTFSGQMVAEDTAGLTGVFEGTLFWEDGGERFEVGPTGATGFVVDIVVDSEGATRYDPEPSEDADACKSVERFQGRLTIQTMDGELLEQVPLIVTRRDGDANFAGKVNLDPPLFRGTATFNPVGKQSHVSYEMRIQWHPGEPAMEGQIYAETWDDRDNGETEVVEHSFAEFSGQRVAM